MKRNYSNPQQLAHDILDMNCRNLVIYCHPYDKAYANELLTESFHVMGALSVVNCVATVKPVSSVEQGLLILAQDNNVTVDASLNVITNQELARRISDAAHQATMRNLGYKPVPKFDAVQVGRDAYKQVVDSGLLSKIRKGGDPFALDPNLEPVYDTIMNRVNAHQLAQEAMQREEFGYQVFIPGTFAKRLRNFERTDSNTDEYFQLLVDLHGCVKAQLKD